MSNKDVSKYESDYSESGFWDKVEKYAKDAGEGVLGNALKLYYAAQDSDTPAWAKATIWGALGYFISPLDAIPDITPILGYTDDAATLLAAITAVAAHIKDKHTAKAKETLKEWFS